MKLIYRGMEFPYTPRPTAEYVPPCALNWRFQPPGFVPSKPKVQTIPTPRALNWRFRVPTPSVKSAVAKAS